MAGFECTDKLNAFGNRVDFLSITKHLELIDEDYNNLQQFNIATLTLLKSKYFWHSIS